MEVDYREALASLESMFPNFDRESIQAVLASNDGHMERTIEDLMKLNEEIENQPDDDNLFSDPVPSYKANQGSNPNVDINFAKSLQETEDAKLAYQLQMQYMQQEPQPRPEAIRTQNNARVDVRRDIQGGEPVPENNGGVQKKKGFYKKLKVALNNLFARKGKSGRKGPTKNPGIYTQIEPADNNLLYQHVDDDDNEPPMKLSDVLGGNRHEEDISPPIFHDRDLDLNDEKYKKDNRPQEQEYCGYN